MNYNQKWSDDGTLVFSSTKKYFFSRAPPAAAVISLRRFAPKDFRWETWKEFFLRKIFCCCWRLPEVVSTRDIRPWAATYSTRLPVLSCNTRRRHGHACELEEERRREEGIERATQSVRKIPHARRIVYYYTRRSGEGVGRGTVISGMSFQM